MVDSLRFILELGYPWGGAVLALLVTVAAIMFRWKLGDRSLRALLVNWLVLSVVLICTIGFLFFYRYYGLPQPFTNAEIGFLVAQLSADADRSKQESYVQAIKGLAAQSQDLQNLRVNLLERPLPADLVGQQAEALKLGERLGASFVLRPVPVQGGNVVVWLTRVPLPAQEGGAADRSHTPMECPLPGNPQIVAKSCVLVALVRGSLCGRVEEELQELLKSPDFAGETSSFLNLLRSGSDTCGSQVNAALSSASAELVASGEKAYRLGSADDAITALRRALALDPNTPEALFSLGNILIAKQQWKPAIASLSRGLELKPDEPEGLNSLCYSLYADAQYDAAIATCEKGLKIRPGYSRLLNNLGLSLAARGRNTEAIAAFRKSISADPHNQYPHFNLGLTLEKQGKTSDAQKEFNEAQRLDPKLRR